MPGWYLKLVQVDQKVPKLVNKITRTTILSLDKISHLLNKSTRI